MSQTEIVSVNGWQLNVRRQGRGRPILVLHGEDEGPQWLPWMTRLAEVGEVIAPEHPGFGAEDLPDWLENVGDLAYFYLDYLKIAGLTNVHLVGCSLGGWAACELAVRSTQRLASLTLVASEGIHVAGVDQADAFLGEEQQQIKSLFYDETHASGLLAFRGDPANEDLFLRRRLSAARLTWQPRGYNPGLARWLHRIDRPTKLIWGADDRFVPPEHAAEFQRLIPGADVEILPNCGHVPQIEAEHELADRIVRFIEETA